MKAYCNPINLSYKYQHYKGKNTFAFREAADPTLILFKGTYYMFASMSGGFWYSNDLIEWSFHENRNLLIYDYAPDVCQIGDYLYFSASKMKGNCPFIRTKSPLSDEFEEVSASMNFYDPALFLDEDNRVYLYWGCNKGKPLYGVELEPTTMRAKGEIAELIFPHPKERGYERLLEVEPNQGLLERLFSGTFIEGSFVNKHNGKYYLQYASPATAEHGYNNGVYVSDKPLSGYKAQEHNPFSSKPGGFITGAGHGSTIQDKYGNWWHAASMRISVNKNFERRIGIFPAGFDEDGILFCNQNFADYPLVVPEGKFDPWEIKPEWMLLSYKKSAKASSSKLGHEPQNALNEDIRTFWCASEMEKNSWFELDLEEKYEIHAVQINFADYQVPTLKLPKAQYGGSVIDRRYIDTSKDIHTRYLLEGSVDGKVWFVLADKTNADSDLPHDFLLFEEGIVAQFLRITATELPYGECFALSGLRVFGKGNGNKPDSVKPTAVRTGDMDASISWEKSNDAIGYNIRYGIAENKLYSSWMVYDDNKLELPMLCKGQRYCIAVDAFNENGITEGEKIWL